MGTRDDSVGRVGLRQCHRDRRMWSWFDWHHKPRREVLLMADHERARIMADFYVHVRGAER
jgi:hypothetical protein